MGTSASRAPLRRLTLLGLVPLTMLLVIACSEDEPEPPATPEPTATADPEPAFRVAPPASLQSYRYEVTLSALLGALSTETPEALAAQSVELSIHGERINPDRERTLSLGELGPIVFEVESVRIGEQQWIREGARPWTESAGSGADILGGADFRPDALFTDDPAEYEALALRLAAHPWQSVTVDGAPALHFTFTQEQFFEVFQGQGDIVPPDVEAALSADIWLSEEFGTPLRLLVVGITDDGAEVLRLQLDIRDMNDASIEVSSPI